MCLKTAALPRLMKKPSTKIVTRNGDGIETLPRGRIFGLTIEMVNGVVTATEASPAEFNAVGNGVNGEVKFCRSGSGLRGNWLGIGG